MPSQNFIQWSVPYVYDNGSQCSIAINDNGLVVEIHNAPTWEGDGIYSKTCNYNAPIDGPLLWSQIWGLGATPGTNTPLSIDINNDYAVMVYQDDDKNLYYQWGTIVNNNTGILWTEWSKYTNGEQPTVAINNNNLAIAISQDSGFTDYTMWYAMGTPTGMSETTQIEIPGGDTINGTTMQVAINVNGIVVIAYQDAIIPDSLYVIVGVNANSGGVGSWGEVACCLNGISGGFDVALDDNNNVVIMSTFRTGPLDDGWYIGCISGTVDPVNRTVNFADNAMPVAYNVSSEIMGTTMAMNNNGLLVAETSGAVFPDFVYLYGQAYLSADYSNWMGENLGAIGDIPLSLLALPGTHDSGTFPISQFSTVSPDNPQEVLSEFAPTFAAPWAQAQDLPFLGQLNAGIRYFDLRVINWSAEGNYYLCHGFYAALLSDLFQDIQTFYAQGGNYANEIILLDMNHIYTDTGAVSFGEDCWMPGGPNSQFTALCNYINSQIGNMLLPPTMNGWSLNQIIGSPEYTNGGRIILFFDDTYSIQQNTNYWPNVDSNNSVDWTTVDGQQLPAPTIQPTINSIWPDVQDVGSLTSYNETNVVQPILIPAWNNWINNSTAPENFTVMQCIGTEGSAEIENGIILASAPVSLQGWEAGICSPSLFWVNTPGVGLYTNILLVDWLEQTIVTPLCVQLNLQKAQAIQAATAKQKTESATAEIK